jgi:hypothetical protein
MTLSMLLVHQARMMRAGLVVCFGAAAFGIVLAAGVNAELPCNLWPIYCSARSIELVLLAICPAAHALRINVQPSAAAICRQDC